MLRKEGGRQRVKTRWRSQAMAEGAGALVVGVGPFRAAVLEPPSSSRRPRAADAFLFLLLQDTIVLNILAPVKVFGDLHGQLPDMLAFFR